MRFEAADRGEGPSWWLYDKDELLASPDRYYATLAFAEREAAAFRAGASGVTFEVFSCPGGALAGCSADQLLSGIFVTDLLSTQPGAQGRQGGATQSSACRGHLGLQC